MTPKKIIAKIKASGSTQSKIAVELGVSPSTVFRVINRLGVSDRIMRAVADVVGEPVHDVFPEYYLAAPKTKRSKAFGSKPKSK
jgi:lambda repressor-like predicted transcriptional regulator